MSSRFDALLWMLRRVIVEPLVPLSARLARALHASALAAHTLRWRLAIGALLVVVGVGLYKHPPYETVDRGEILVRTNVFADSATAYSAGTVVVLPGIHQIRRYPTRDQIYRPLESESAAGAAPFQSNEGLSIGVELHVRWTIDRSRIAQMSKEFPDDLNADLVGPAVKGIVYPLFARHSVREIFSRQRTEIQREMLLSLCLIKCK